ncbi:Sec1-like protein, partial [Kipferlia bialata]
CHLFSSATIGDDEFQFLVDSGCSRILSSLKEVQLEYTLPLSRFITVPHPHSLYAAFGTHELARQKRDQLVTHVSRALGAVFTSFQQGMPTIRYDSESVIARRIAEGVNERCNALDAAGALSSASAAGAESGPRVTSPIQTRRHSARVEGQEQAGPTLLVVDRTDDLFAVLAHFDTFEAVLYDYLDIEDYKTRIYAV